MIFLPGSNRQLNYILKKFEFDGKKVLVMGAGSGEAAVKLQKATGVEVEYIVEDYDALINSKITLEGNNMIITRIMDFSLTDFEKETFDFIYAQASISTVDKNKIVKEIKRILKPEGHLCVGEITALRDTVSKFVKDIWDASYLNPLFYENLEKYYNERKFELVEISDFSEVLSEYYSLSLDKLEDTKTELTNQEKSYHKKLLNRISHESKAFLNQGGDKFMGFHVLLLRKNND